MLNIAEKAGPIEDQVLEAVKQGQEAVIKAVRTWAEAAEAALPDLPELPATEQLPRVADIVDHGFAFADKLIASQREFAAALLEAAKPAYGSVDKAADLAAEKVRTAKSGTSVTV